MKPFELYSLIRSLTREGYNQRKLPFFLARAKAALNNLRSHGWEDEQIKSLVINTVTALMAKGAPLSFQYIISILCNTTHTPGVKSVEAVTNSYDSWIEQEKKRVGNAE